MIALCDDSDCFECCLVVWYVLFGHWMAKRLPKMANCLNHWLTVLCHALAYDFCFFWRRFIVYQNSNAMWFSLIPTIWLLFTLCCMQQWISASIDFKNASFKHLYLSPSAMVLAMLSKWTKVGRNLPDGDTSTKFIHGNVQPGKWNCNCLYKPRGKFELLKLSTLNRRSFQLFNSAAVWAQEFKGNGMGQLMHMLNKHVWAETISTTKV